MTDLVEVDLASLVRRDHRSYYSNCSIVASREVIERSRFISPEMKKIRENYRIEIPNPLFRGNLSFLLGAGTSSVLLEGVGPMNATFRLWRESSIRIGAGTTITEARIICDNADIDIGSDGLWSDEILVQSNDQHGIVDLETGALLNAGRRRISIGDHVWVGRRTLLMPDIEIGSGSILAAGAVLTRSMPKNTIFAGVPAKMVRENVSWSRLTDGLSASETRLLGLEADNKENTR